MRDAVPTPRRNVLFVVIDQLRADCVWGALAAHVDLPHLRGLAANGVRFSNHYSVTAPCGPSRASLLTGQYAMNHGAVRNGTPLPQDTPNLARAARSVGYAPRLYGYTDISADPRCHDPGDPKLRSYEQVLPGFDEAVEMRFEESWPWRADLLSKGYDLPSLPELYRPAGPRPDDPAHYRAEDSDTAFLTDRLISDLRGRAQGWFAHLTYIRPHPPLVAPAPYNRLVDASSLPAPATALDDHPHDAAARRAHPASATVEGFPDLPETAENVAMLRALYLGLAAEVDHHLGRVLAFLKDTGQYDDTLIVLTADHGEMLGDYGLWGKSSFRDASFRVPLIVRDPASKARGRVVDAPTESIDVLPTILDLIGAAIPEPVDGRSLRPFLAGESPADWRQETFSELDFGDPLQPTAIQRALDVPPAAANLAILRRPQHTLVQFAADLPAVLFDRAADGEARNIATEPAAQPVLLDMTQRMIRHRLTHAHGAFPRTMITSEGPKSAPKYGVPEPD